MCTKLTVSALAHGDLLLCCKQTKHGPHIKPGTISTCSTVIPDQHCPQTPAMGTAYDCIIIMTHSDLLEALNSPTGNH